MKYEDTHKFALALLETLRESFFVDGELDKQRLHRYAPSNHYAATCFTVAAFRASAYTGDDRFYQAGKQTLSYFLDLPEDERGHEEFNSFALLEAIEDERNEHYDLPVSEEELTDLIEYSSSLSTRDGNNWLLLQALCQLKFADLFDSRNQRQQAMNILNFSNRWLLYDGIIADEPRYRLAPIQTPLTYHAKCSMLYARIANRVSDPASMDQVERCIRALSRVCLPNGECLYFGRSENTVFGYASAIDAVSRFDALPDSPDWTNPTKHAIVRFLLSQFDAKQPDCQPGHFSDDDRRLDSYIYDAVYSAFAAMLLLGLPSISPPKEGQNSPKLEQNYEFLDHSGLLTARGDRSALGMATRGQLRPRNSGPDYRYAGLIPHTFTHEGTSVFPGIPTAADGAEVAPFLPVINHNDDRYVPVIWDSTVTEHGTRVSVRGDGSYYKATTADRTYQDDSQSRSLLNRVKKQIKRHERLRQRGERIQRLFQRAFRISRLDLVHQSYANRPESIPIRTRRSVHYLRDDDVLVLQTGTITPSDSQVLPSSVIIKGEYVPALEINYSTGDGGTRREVMAHKGPADWYVPQRWSQSRTTWSVMVLDPSNRIKTTESDVTDGLLTTDLETKADTETVTTSLAGPSKVYSIDPRPR